ncbi:MAG: hypothetical protein ACO23R_17705, partial [bacterium]
MIQTDQLSVKRDYHATIGTEVQMREVSYYHHLIEIWVYYLNVLSRLSLLDSKKDCIYTNRLFTVGNYELF